MKKIDNMDDLRYRKLYLRSEIKIKEQKIINGFRKLQAEIEEVDFKNDIVQGMINNPALVINTARISYDIVTRIRRWQKNRKNRNV